MIFKLPHQGAFKPPSPREVGFAKQKDGGSYFAFKAKLCHSERSEESFKIPRVSLGMTWSGVRQ